ncbi:zinc-binding dehydrogenase [Aeoliella mucimassa]|uniref:zinc-binding dehydrogenase n=1 Tax=Aeoliella mucimassa TaxID=2527972 RepID=UPI0011A62E79|nr:zinc-binding dehydrogenase [Aeoliella mucimassa]
MPTTVRAAVMTAPGRELEIKAYPLLPPVTGGALVRVTCCTICRSDLHTWRGRRPGPTPAILGHEIVGEIAALAEDVTHDSAGQPLAPGDRVTWTLHSSCGECYYCREHQLPMKCLELQKYGHDACDQPPHLQGGFAEYCHISAGTSLLKLPDNIPDTVAAPLNCAAATVVAGWDAAELKPGEHVLIQGAGGLGCYAAAMASFAGAERIIVTDIHSERLEFVRRFGATDCINVASLTDEQIANWVRELTGGFGVDCAMEVAGVPAVVPAGLASLRKGGRFVELGCSFPEATTSLDLSTILWNLLTIRGVHNYDFRHLQQAVDFVSQTIDRFPFDELTSRQFKLEDIDQAIAAAEQNGLGRVAIVFD